MAKTFPSLIYVRARGIYSWQPSDSWLSQNVQNHGALGAVYPDRRYEIETPSPSIFHTLSNGLHDPDDLTQNGWGGRYVKQDNVEGESCVDHSFYFPYQMYTDVSGSIDRLTCNLSPKRSFSKAR